jgi:hypothetical protein
MRHRCPHDQRLGRIPGTMKNNASLTWATMALAGLLVAGVTVVQGMWTERWGRREDGGRLASAAAVLERVFPERFGDWVYEQELESNDRELQRAGAVGHVSKLYRNERTKTRVSAFVVCAAPHDASGHTPDRCYPGAGFEIGESEHRHEVTLVDGSTAETFTATFRKAGQTLRIFWTYGVPEDEADTTGRFRWIAPGIARIALSGEPAVYKIYAIIDQTKLTTSQATAECSDFLSMALAALNERLVAAKQEDVPSADGPRDEAATGAVANPTGAALGG